MSEGPESARLFVALELPASVREALVEWRSGAVGDVRGLRLLQPADLHVTLCFLGWRTLVDVPAVLDAVGVVGSEGAAPLRLGAPVWLPPRRPRVLAVELEDLSGRLGAVQATLSRVLSEGRWYVTETRPFLAHVTVARVGKRNRVRAVRVEPPPALSFEGSTVTLYRSHLSPAGARYEPLGTVAL